MTMRLKECTSQNVDELVAQEGGVLLHFGTDWCTPCKRLERVLLELLKENRLNVAVAKINVEDEPELASRFGVSKNPTLCLTRKGSVTARREGFADAEAVLAFVGGDTD